MFDNHRHFASTFPQMAKSSTHLRYSILALSARQLERQQNRKSQSESLYLYQEAIHLLLPELGSKTTPVIASCVILCVLEMLSCRYPGFPLSCASELMNDRQSQGMASPFRWLCVSYSSSWYQRLLWEGRASSFLVLCSDGYEIPIYHHNIFCSVS
jgi:hypothetical protein